ncbi:MAG: proline racemase family protein [Phycisphaerales bacterium JB043]
MHTGGEPLRVVLGGGPRLEAESVLGARREMMERHDGFRTRLMWEPRGHADMYGALLLPPERGDSDFGVLFLHNEGYSTMCGHATIALGKLAVLMGWVDTHDGRGEVRIDAPCGQLTVDVVCDANGAPSRVGFLNVESYVVSLDNKLTLSDGRVVGYDLAFGGAYYAYVDSEQLGLRLVPESFAEIVRVGRAMKREVVRTQTIEHPFEEDLGFLYGTIFIEPSDTSGVHSRNVCVFAEGEVDRSPTGSGVSGRAAIHHARGELSVGEAIRIESLIGSTMDVCIDHEKRFGPHDAVVPRVYGDAWITGFHDFVIDPDDPFADGFVLR